MILLFGHFCGLVGKTSALELQRSWVRIQPEYMLVIFVFHQTQERTEFTVRTHIGVMAKPKLIFCILDANLVMNIFL